MINNFSDVKTINQSRYIENTIHNLKTLPKYFQETMWGNKNFEVRKNDRNFKVNDIVILEEFDGRYYTGRKLAKRIIYILDDEAYCKEGYVVLGIR